MASVTTLKDRQELVRKALKTLIQAAPTEDRLPGKPVLLDLDYNGDDLYLTALLDLLVWLGAVNLSPDRMTAHVPTVQAGYLLRLGLALLDGGRPLMSDWSREGLLPLPNPDWPLTWANGSNGTNLMPPPFGTGVNLLAALERRRLEQYPDAAPLREIRAAVGLVTQPDATGIRWYLLARDEATGRWQLPGGRYEQHDGTLRATLLRELAEELACGPLAEPEDVTLRELGEPLIETRLSPTYGLLTSTCFQVYAVNFPRGLPWMHGVLRWASETEVLEGLTADGWRIDAAPLKRLLERSEAALDALEICA